MKQEAIHRPKFMLFECELQRAAVKNIEARVHNTLCEGIILQKRFVKKRN
jgi:hypothetical protein